MTSSPPGDGGCDVDGCGEGGGEFVVSRGDASPVFESAEHSFDHVALAVELSVERVRALAGGIVRNDGQRSALGEELAQSVAVVSGVGCADSGRRQGRKQAFGGADVSELPCRDLNGYRAAMPVDDGVDFRRPAAARTANRLDLRPPFPPAALR